MKKKLVSLVLALCFLFAFFANTSTTHASGWSFYLNNGEYWGSSSVTTAYPYLELSIDWDFALGNQGTGWPLNRGCVKVQKLVGGSWVDVTSSDCSHYGNWYVKIAATKGVSYRVFVKHDDSTIIPASGTVNYAGFY